MPKRAALYRLLIASAAWVWVAVILLGIARLAIPPVGAFLEDPSPGSLGTLVAKALVVVMGLSSLVGWIATILHVAGHAPLRSPAQRAIIIAFLLVLNFGSALVYYFAYLLWVPKASDVAAAL